MTIKVDGGCYCKLVERLDEEISFFSKLADTVLEKQQTIEDDLYDFPTDADIYKIEKRVKELEYSIEQMQKHISEE